MQSHPFFYTHRQILEFWQIIPTIKKKDRITTLLFEAL